MNEALERVMEPSSQHGAVLSSQDLHSRNETLYHYALVEHMQELAPLIYTPTVGHVCEQFGNQFTRTRGMYFSRDDRGHFASMVYNWPRRDVHIICVTDGSFRELYIAF